MNRERDIVKNEMSKSSQKAAIASRNNGFTHDQFIDVVGIGASAALVSDSPCAMNSLRGLSLLQVQDTLTKLHQLAPNYRRLMPRRPKVSPSISGSTVFQ